MALFKGWKLTKDASQIFLFNFVISYWFYAFLMCATRWVESIPIAIVIHTLKRIRERQLTHDKWLSPRFFKFNFKTARVLSKGTSSQKIYHEELYSMLPFPRCFYAFRMCATRTVESIPIAIVIYTLERIRERQFTHDKWISLRF